MKVEETEQLVHVEEPEVTPVGRCCEEDDGPTKVPDSVGTALQARSGQAGSEEVLERERWCTSSFGLASAAGRRLR